MELLSPRLPSLKSSRKGSGPQNSEMEDRLSMSMPACFAAFVGLAMQIVAHPQPPQILQIHREPLKPGSEAAYQEIEEDTARICAQLRCPHPYLGIESLIGSREVWFFNGYESPAEQQQVVDDYATNAPLLAALKRNSRRKASLTGEPVGVFANYRKDLSRGVPWILGQGRFLVITVTKSHPRIDGTAFEAADGTRFIVLPVQTRSEADAAAAAAGPESRVFAVRPSWSLPAKEWVAADSEFWHWRAPNKTESKD